MRRPDLRLLGLALVLLAAPAARGYDYSRVNGQAVTWDPPTVPIQIKMATSPTLSDGSNYTSSVQAAMDAWNAQIATVQLVGQPAGAGPAGDANHVSEISFGSEVYPGEAFDANVLAVTISRYSETPRADGTYRRTETDIVFNTAYTWDSYRGGLRVSQDVRRVAMHELGHVLGLKHPDQATPPQSVSALMNSRASALDTITADDIAGAVFLYGPPSTPPTILAQPTPRTNYVGEDAKFSVVVRGSPPLAYQWKKGGTPIAGQTTDVLNLAQITTADTGTYSVDISNPYGSVTSNGATLNVVVPRAPVITNIPATLTVAYGEALSFFTSVDADPAAVLQWYKDDVAIPNAYNNYLNIQGVTAANGGTYKLVAKNVAGTATSNLCVVTISPPVPPTITFGPYPQTGTVGSSMGMGITVVGTQPMTYQWYRDGVPVPGATNASLTLNPATKADNGNYTVRVTNLAGSAESSAARMTVLPVPPPSFSSFYNWQVTISPTSSLNLPTFLNFQGGVNYTYQWYKDGVAIPGAVGGGYYKNPATEADAGNYSVMVSNGSGSIMSSDYVVTWNNPPTTLWTDSSRQGNVIYFLATSPGRIMRYDLAQESWLPVVNLTAGKTPTAFLPTADGVFIAYGTALVRRSLDLQAETDVATSTQPITSLFSYLNWLYYFDGTNVRTRDRGSLAPGPVFPPTYPDLASGVLARPVRPLISSLQHQGYTTAYNLLPSSLVIFGLADDGTFFRKPEYYRWSGTMPIGSRQYLSPDEQCIFDNSGLVYRASDLGYRASLGLAFADVTFFSDGAAVLLRSNKLSLRSATDYGETGQFTLPSQAFALFNQGDATYAFGAAPSAAANPTVTKVTRSQFASAVALPPAPTANLPFTVDGVYLDRNAIINVVSRSAHCVVRWSPASQTYLTPIPLGGNPSFCSYAPAVDRLVLCYSQTRLTYLNLAGDQQERRLAEISNPANAMVAMDDYTLVRMKDSGDSGFHSLLFDATGQNATPVGTQVPVMWQSSNRHAYFTGDYGNDDVSYKIVPTNGLIDGSSTPRNPGGTPVGISPDGAVVISAKGKVMNAELVETAHLENPVSGAAWLGDGLYTIRTDPDGTEVQQWNAATYAKVGNLTLPGIPVRILALTSTRLAVATLVNGYLAFHLVDANRVLVGTWVNSTNKPVITRPPASMQYADGATVVLFVEATGGVLTYQWRRNGTPIAGKTSATLTLTGLSAADSGASYDVVVTNVNGSVTSSAATLTVIASKQAQTITFDAVPNRTFGDQPFSVVVSASSQLPVTLTSISGPAATSGTTVALTGAGTVTLRATQGGDSTYAAAVPVDRTFTVAKRNATVTLSNLAQAVTGSPRAVTVTTVPSGLTTAVTYNGTSTAPSTAGSYAVVATVAEANYTGLATGTLVLTGAVAGAPVISVQPGSTTLSVGGTAVFSVVATGNAPLGYQWRRNGNTLAGQTGSSLTLAGVSLADSGASFDVVVSNANGTVTSAPAVLYVAPPAAGLGQIFFGTISGGGSFAVYVRPGGEGLLTGVWPGNRGSFVVTFTIGSGGAFNVALPASTTGPAPSMAGRGDPLSAQTALSLSGQISGGNFTGAVSGTGETFSAAIQPASGSTSAWAGLYEAPIVNSSVGMTYLIVGTNGSCVAATVTPAGTNAAVGTVNGSGQFSAALGGGETFHGTLDAASGTVSGSVTTAGGADQSFGGVSATTTHTDRLVNISTRGLVGDADRAMIAGFVITGPLPKTVLVRASGPSLGSYGVPGTMADPVLKIYRGETEILGNDDWTLSPDLASLISTGTRVGAFPQQTTSPDAAVLATLEPGIYSAQVTRHAGTALGLALVEVYDAGGNPGLEAQKVVNISTRGAAGTGAEAMIAGFVITGNVPKKVLIRGIGPTLAGYGVSGTLAHPRLELFAGQTVIASNQDWSVGADAALIPAAAAQVGAFALTVGSGDAALLVTLAPGTYSAKVSGADGASGVVLLEVYEVP